MPGPRGSTYPDVVSRAVRLTPAVVLDGVLALALLAFTQLELRASWDDGFRAGADLARAGVLVPLMVAPFALRTLAPVVAWAAMLGAYMVTSLVALQPFLFWGYAVPLAVATYTVARRDHGPAGRFAFLTGPALLAVISLHTLRYDDLNDSAFVVLMYAAAWLAGRFLRRLQLQGEQLAVVWAELAESGAGRRHRAVEADRRKVAADMHDIVAHAAGLTVLQVGAARLVLETQGAPELAVRQLLEAEHAGREALDELRRLLGVLRDSAETRSAHHEVSP